MDVRIRYYCLALPSDGQQMGFDYLVALDATKRGVRALPIGPAFLMAGPWPKVMHLFIAPLPTGRYVNVVCAPLGLSQGFASSRAEMGALTPPARGAGGKIELPGDEKDIVYVPQTAISGLFTVGVPNIAVTQPPRAAQSKPSEAELAALRLYDFILCPTMEAVAGFAELRVSALHVPPDAGQLAQLIDVLLQ